MALQKQNLNINFAQGLDTKSDPWQVQPGKFLSLVNSVFTKAGLLGKRNGFKKISTVSEDNTYLTNYLGNLISIGNSVSSYSSATGEFVSKGNIQPVSLDVLPIIRNNVNQSQADSVLAENGLVCTVYTESNGSSTSYKYVISSSITGQNIVAPTAIPVTSGAVTGSPRVFYVGKRFIIVFTNVITAVSHLQFIAIDSVVPTNVTANADIASAYISSTRLSWDAVASGTSLYVAYNTTSGGQSIRVTSINAVLAVATPKTLAGQIATIMSMCVDSTNPASPTIYASYYDSAGSTGYTLAIDQNLNTVLSPTQWLSTGTILNVASAAQNGVNKIYYEVSNTYSFDASIPSNYIDSKTVTVAGVVSSASTVIRSVGLASKAFIVDGTQYFLAIQQSQYQPTYFLINGSSSLSSSPVIVAKLAYQNGGVYAATGLPGVSVSGNTARVSYFFKDLVQAVNKDTNVPSGTQIAGIYSQTGINLATFVFGTQGVDTADIANDLHITGGYLTMYDGYLPVEHGFFLWPELQLNADGTYHGLSTSGAGGSITAQKYYYQVTYEWSDNQGNQFKSSPSVPVSITTTGSTSTNTLIVPCLRLTSKVSNPVKIVAYRWSQAQQSYYQVTSITQPKLNTTTSDTVTITDTFSDAQILGNNLIYTTGGVLENIPAPSSDVLALFDNRLWLIDSENKNVLWPSKEISQATPIEMSDQLTLYVAPTTAAQGSTGPMLCLSAMDDKLIIFKRNAIYYINGTGPDSTGANSQYSQPTFITSTVGCANNKSIVFMPNGLMFQSDKGIWLLGRDLSTSYIGAPVEEFTNNALVNSAVNIPGTNQVRFTLSTGITLMYDYYYGQWGTHEGVPAISSTLYQDLHTFIDSYGRIFQETPNQYLDGSNPVLMRFKTSWFNLAGLQGYERAYWFYLIGNYISPHKLLLKVAYNYNPYPTQQSIISPDNYTAPWGGDATWGSSSPWGGIGTLEQWQVYLQQQTCQSFQISFDEIFDSAYGTKAGAGLTLSGINCTIGLKKGSRPIRAANTVG